MDRQLGDITARVPTLEPGVTVVYADERSTAHHQLVLATLQEHRGPAIWIDAGDTASTYALYELTSNPRILDGLSIARAWTAYQHHTLIRQSVERANARTRLLVVPNVHTLYQVEDVPSDEGDWLLSASLTILGELARSLSIPVLLTCPTRATLPDGAAVDHEFEWERTAEGDTFVGADGQSTIYRGAWWWQTPIPYWVELFGARDEQRWTPAEPTMTAEPAILEY